MSWLTNISGSAIGATFRDGYQIWEILRGNINAINAQFSVGTGSPEGVVTAGVSAVYLQSDGVYGTTIWTKASGSGNIGWKTTTPILKAEVTLTDAQIKALPTTGITVVPAPGSGFRTAILRSFFDINTAAGAYTNISANGQLALLESGGNYFSQPLANDTVTANLTTLTDFIGTAGRHFGSFGVEYEDAFSDWGVLPYPSATTDYENKAVLLKAVNAAGNFTGGNAANSMRVVVVHMPLSTL